MKKSDNIIRFCAYFVLYAFIALMIAWQSTAMYQCGFAKSFLYDRNVGVAWLLGYCE